MKKIHVVISKDNKHAVSDWEARNWYQNLLNSGETAYVASSIMLNELRVGVRLKEIEPFSFEYEGGTYSIGEDAKLSPDWPKGFMDHQAIQMLTIMTGKTREEVLSIGQ